jgi:small subunit ribosomal protein S6e
MKIVFNDVKTGHSFQKEVEASKESQLFGKKIRDTIEGGLIGLTGYTLTIKGGSDKEGFPMLPEIRAARAYPLLDSGPGVRHLRKGVRIKKTVAGHTVSERTSQLNCAITEYGSKSLEDCGFAYKERTKEEKAVRKPEKDAKKKAKAKKGK